jgi:arginyl-tRNA synthetase
MWHGAGAMSVDPVPVLRQRVLEAMRGAFGDAAAAIDPAIHRSDHADYQADAALALARQVKRNPREVAQAIVERLPADDLIGEAVVSGPGFINLALHPQALAGCLDRMLADARLGVPAVATPETVVVDYSAPNIAKEMHIGHLRTTVIGDALVRLLEFVGHTVMEDWLYERLREIRRERLRDQDIPNRPANVA